MPVRTLPAWPAGRPLRAWQEEAVAAALAHPQRSFLASATPAAGKTTFGLHVAHRMLSEGRVGRVCVVAPTTHICRQWAADAARYGHRHRAQPAQRRRAGAARPPRRRGDLRRRSRPARRCTAAAAQEVPTLLLADEPHHMGDQAAWGRSAQSAFEGARFRLLLSGTPFRSDNTPIPWVAYDDDGVSRADYAYGYTDALLDGVCRPVTFHTYDGDMEWVSDGRRRRADFSVVPARRRGGAPAAHRARPRRRLGRPRPARRRRAAERAARRRAPRRRRARGRDRQGARGASSPSGWRGSPASEPTIVTSDDRGRLGADRALRRRERALARVGADGLRGRRRPAAARRRLRDHRAHGAVLPPGRRPLHPPHAGAAASR